MRKKVAEFANKGVERAKIIVKCCISKVARTGKKEVLHYKVAGMEETCS